MRDNLSLVFKNAGWLFLAEVLTKLFSFIIAVVLARYLQPEGYGVWSFAMSLGASFAFVADFGFNRLVSRDLARDKGLVQKYLANILPLKLVLGAVSWLLVAGTAYWLGKQGLALSAALVLGFYVILQTFFQVLLRTFRAFEQMFWETLARVAQSLLLLAGVAWLVFVSSSFLALAWFYVGVALVGLVMAKIILAKKLVRFGLQFDFGFWKKLLFKAWPFLLVGAFSAVYYYIDTIMLSFLKTDEVVGWYNAAYRVVFVLIALGGVLASAFLPTLSRLWQGGRDDFGKVFGQFLSWLAFLAFPVGAGILITAPNILGVFFGQSYLPGAVAFQILGASVIFVILKLGPANLLQAADKERILSFGVGLGAVFNVILNLLLIPTFSLEGAALATLLTELAIFSYLLIKAHKVQAMPILAYWWRPALAALIMFLVLSWLNFGLAAAVPAGVFIYLALFWAFGGFKGLNYGF